MTNHITVGRSSPRVSAISASPYAPNAATPNQMRRRTVFTIPDIYVVWGGLAKPRRAPGSVTLCGGLSPHLQERARQLFGSGTAHGRIAQLLLWPQNSSRQMRR